MVELTVEILFFKGFLLYVANLKLESRVGDSLADEDLLTDSVARCQ